MFFAHTTHFRVSFCFILISYCSIFKDRFAIFFTTACTLYHRWIGLVNSFLKIFSSFFRIFFAPQNMVFLPIASHHIYVAQIRAYYIYNKWRKAVAPLQKQKDDRRHKITNYLFDCCNATPSNLSLEWFCTEQTASKAGCFFPKRSVRQQCHPK